MCFKWTAFDGLLAFWIIAAGMGGDMILIGPACYPLGPCPYITFTYASESSFVFAFWLFLFPRLNIFEYSEEPRGEFFDYVELGFWGAERLASARDGDA